MFFDSPLIPFFFKFNDLYEMIYDIAVESGVEITYGAEVTDVDIPQRIVSLQSSVDHDTDITSVLEAI